MNQNAMCNYDLFSHETQRQRDVQGGGDASFRRAPIELGNAVPQEGAAGAERCVISRSSPAQRSLN